MTPTPTTDSAVSPVSDGELAQWAQHRADDAGRLARELIQYRRLTLADVRKQHPISDEGLRAIAAQQVGIDDPYLCAELATELLSRRFLDTTDGVEAVAWMTEATDGLPLNKRGTTADPEVAAYWAHTSKVIPLFASRTPNTEMVVKALQQARDAFNVEYDSDGKVQAVGYDSNALRPLVAMLDAALASPPSPAEVTKWQPIETAPKDGTWFLGYRPDLEVQETIDVWHWDASADTDGAPGFWVNAADSNLDEYPTHWQPLEPLTASLQLNKKG
jgi:hypothetical protein